jgi:hypothetical protein
VLAAAGMPSEAQKPAAANDTEPAFPFSNADQADDARRDQAGSKHQDDSAVHERNPKIWISW